MPAYTVREWERLPYGPGDGEIPEGLADQLAACARASIFAGKGETGVLEHGRHALRARGVVGVIATRNVCLEILPKIEVAVCGSRTEENAAIRKRLVHMLAVALDLKIETGAIAELDWQKDTLLEILIRIFSEKLTDALRKGMPRSYLEQEDDLRSLRGKLNVTRQFTRHAVNPSRLACRFDILSEDTRLNQIMKAAVLQLSRISRSPANQQRLRELKFIYNDISDVPPASLRPFDVAIDRTNRAWRELAGMARMFLTQRYQSTTGGSADGTALLFEMNTLFEEYIGRLIARALAGSGLTVSLQGGRLFCLTSEETGRGVFQTRPDILIRRDRDVVQVIDTKWKRIASRIDDAKQGVSQADVYQMMAYAQLYEAPRLTLLYPHHPGLGECDGVQARHRISGQEPLLETATIDVSNGTQILDRLRMLCIREPDAAF